MIIISNTSHFSLLTGLLPKTGPRRDLCRTPLRLVSVPSHPPRERGSVKEHVQSSNPHMSSQSLGVLELRLTFWSAPF